MEVNKKLDERLLRGHFVKDILLSDASIDIYTFVRSVVPRNGVRYYIKAPVEKKDVSIINCIS
ncbi:MAG: hypothetical protein Hyperionvirus6_110, partial [Hyperionvirus sp.]